MMTKIDYKSLTLGELKTLLGEMGQPAFRAARSIPGCTRSQVTSFEEMTNLPRRCGTALPKRGT